MCIHTSGRWRQYTFGLPRASEQKKKKKKVVMDCLLHRLAARKALLETPSKGHLRACLTRPFCSVCFAFGFDIPRPEEGQPMCCYDNFTRIGQDSFKLVIWRFEGCVCPPPK
jgi:hypothetical protein